MRACAEVFPGLYVGGITALEKIEALRITHVVSVLHDASRLEHPQLAACQQRHSVEIADTEEANLLSLLPAAVAFITAPLSSTSGSGGKGGSNGGTSGGSGGNRVLIHCAQGVSRSAAVAAAYLMTASATSAAAPAAPQHAKQAAASAPLAPADALSVLRRAWPASCPNSGFEAQLELWYAMGCRLQDSYVPYKRFLLQQAAQHYQATGGLPEAAALPVPAEAPGGGAKVYRCRKCRCTVATSHNVVDTEQGAGAAAFRWHKRDKHQKQALGSGDYIGGGAGGSEEGSLFVEPLRWMCQEGGSSGDSVMGGAVQGKLYCPKCQARLGSFNWSGKQSSSGAWVVPAFQLQLPKLDTLTPLPPAALTGIRQPRMLSTPSTPSTGTSMPSVPIVPSAPSSQAAPAAAAAAIATAAASAAAEQLQRVTLAEAPVNPAPPSASSSSSTRADAAIGAVGSSVNGVADSSSGNGAGGSSSGSGNEPYFQCLVLDCDGVLVDSERASCEALHQAILQVTEFDIPHAFPEDFQPVFGMDVLHCVEYYQHRFGKQEWGQAAAVAAQVSDVKEGIYQRLTEGGVQAFPGVAQLVAQAQRMGLTVGVASSGTPEKIVHNLGSSGLATLFPDPHLVVSAKHVARGKPAPDVYLETLRRLGCTDASRALVVEDAVNGLKSAKAAGCFTVAVCTSLPAGMLQPHADLVLTHLRDLDLEAVEQLAVKGGSGSGSGAANGSNGET